MWPRPPLLLLLLLLMLLQLVFRKTPQDRSPDRAQEPVAHLVPAEAAGESARDGAAEAALAFLTFGLRVLGVGSVGGRGLVFSEEIGVVMVWGGCLLLWLLMLLAVLLLLLLLLLAFLAVGLRLVRLAVACYLLVFLLVAVTLLAVSLLAVSLLVVVLLLGLTLVAAVLGLLVVGVGHCARDGCEEFENEGCVFFGGLGTCRWFANGSMERDQRLPLYTSAP